MQSIAKLEAEIKALKEGLVLEYMDEEGDPQDFHEGVKAKRAELKELKWREQMTSEVRDGLVQQLEDVRELLATGKHNDAESAVVVLQSLCGVVLALLAEVEVED